MNIQPLHKQNPLKTCLELDIFDSISIHYLDYILFSYFITYTYLKCIRNKTFFYDWLCIPYMYIYVYCTYCKQISPSFTLYIYISINWNAPLHILDENTYVAFYTLHELLDDSTNNLFAQKIYFRIRIVVSSYVL